MSNRQDIAFLTPFANDAETTLPGVPIDGTSYRDTTFNDLGPGWPYKTKVESQDFNQIMYIQTLLMRQLSNQGALDYSDKEDYSASTGAIVMDDGALYVCISDNGPSSSVKQPSSEPSFWRRLDVTEVSPINEDWNGFFTIDHLTPLPSPAGLPDTSGAGGTTYIDDDEWSLNNFAVAGDISLDDDGIIFSAGIYKLFTFTAEQLSLIDVTTVPVYIEGQDGSRHFVKHNGVGVVVTKPDSTTLKVQLNSAIFTELGITKVFKFFVTGGVGFVTNLSPESLVDKLQNYLLRLRTLQDLSASRTQGVTYTNNEAYPIDIFVHGVSTTSARSLTIDGEQVLFFSLATTSIFPIEATIQPGQTYSVLNVGATPTWYELRI